jgi:hypothetical protein
MRIVPTGVLRAAALATVLVVLAVPVAYADGGNPYEPPQSRINPPIGASSQDEASFFERLLDWAWLYARIRPPIG